MGEEMAEKDHERDEEMVLGEGKWQRKRENTREQRTITQIHVH